MAQTITAEPRQPLTRDAHRHAEGYHIRTSMRGLTHFIRHTAHILCTRISQGDRCQKPQWHAPQENKWR